VQRERSGRPAIRPQARRERRRIERGDVARLDLYYESLPKTGSRSREAREQAHGEARAPRAADREREGGRRHERRMRRRDVEGIPTEILYKTPCTKLPYHWPTIGLDVDIEGFTPEDCVAFYKTYYSRTRHDVTPETFRARRPREDPRRLREIPRDDPREDTSPERAAESRRIELKKPTPARAARRYHGRGWATRITRRSRPQRGALRRARVAHVSRARELRGYARSCAVCSTFRSRPSTRCIHRTTRHERADMLARADAELTRVRDEVVTDEELCAPRLGSSSVRTVARDGSGRPSNRLLRHRARRSRRSLRRPSLSE